MNRWAVMFAGWILLFAAANARATELRIGIIQYTRPEESGIQLDAFLLGYFEEIREQYRRRGVQLDIRPVWGNYYQILQWLRDGELDGAIVSSFSAHLLISDDETAVFPIIEFSRNARDAPPASPVPAIVDATLNGKRLPDPERTFRECLTKVTEAVRDPRLPQRCDFRFVSHLSSTGFVMPLLAMEEHAPPDLRGNDSEEFWAKVMEWSRFELWRGKKGPPDRTDMTTLRFSFAGSGEPGVPLKMKRRLPVLNDVLLLANPRLRRGFSWRSDPNRGDPGQVVNTRIPRKILVSSTTAACTENPESPWVAAGRAMDKLPRSGRGYKSTSAWCDPQRETFSRLLETRLQSEAGQALGKRFDLWYEQRSYDFTVEEMIDLLKTDQKIRGRARAALVLPGGGVRATYQSAILDWLYSRHIANAGRTYIPERTERAAASDTFDRVTLEPPPEGRLVIHGIAGTSGGALLGYLASRRDHEPSTVLTDAWITQKNEVKTTPLTIFPAFGVLRWLSILMLLVIFAAAAAIHLRGLPPWPAAPVPFWYTSFLSVIVIGAPFLIWRNAIDDPSKPAKYELVAMLVTVLVVHVIHSTSAPAPKGAPPRYLIRLGLGLIVAGLWAAYLLVKHNPHTREASSELLERTEFWTPLSGAVLLILIAGLTVIAAARGTRIDRVRAVVYFHGVLVLAVLLAGTGLIFFIGLRMGHVTPLEMTLDYWLWLFVGGIVVSKMIVTTGRLFPNAPFQTGIRFLSSTSGTAPFPYTPTMSLAIWGGLAALVWVVFVSPALYSGENGRNAFRSAQALMSPARERVPLVVSMTGFGAQLPRFESLRGDFYANDAEWSQDLRVSDRTMAKRLYAVPPHTFQDAVFASGSPFPIYPAASVQIEPPPSRPGLFVDGGYAHLVPIEAAGLFDAAQVLVIENVARQQTEARQRESQRVGTLTTNLGKVFDYLFERAQDVDLRASRQAVVGTIAPDWTGPNPFLMDFRESVIRRLKAEAMDDLRGHRIARVQSWGLPAPPEARRAQ